MRRARQLYNDEKTRINCEKSNVPYIKGRQRPREGIYKDISSDDEPEFDTDIDFANMQYEQELKRTSLAAHGKPKTEVSEKQWAAYEKSCSGDIKTFIAEDK